MRLGAPHGRSHRQGLSQHSQEEGSQWHHEAPPWGQGQDKAKPEMGLWVGKAWQHPWETGRDMGSRFEHANPLYFYMLEVYLIDSIATVSVV